MHWAEQLLDPANLLAIIGVVVAIAGLAYERLIPGRKRIGYRVQMDAAIDDSTEDPRLRQRLNILESVPELEGASMVLLRIENDGFRAVDAGDYITSPDNVGLVVRFPDRKVMDVMVTEPSHAHLVNYLPNDGSGPRYGEPGRPSEILLPKVPLNRGEFYKLLVLLTDLPGHRPPHPPGRVDGSIREGKVRNNERFRAPNNRVLGIVLSLVLLLVFQPIAFQALRGRPAPMGCVPGSLTVVGSTAFAPVMQAAADRYDTQCPGTHITVSTSGSGNGTQLLHDLGKSGSAGYLSMSDGIDENGYRDLVHQVVAVPVFTLVAGADTGVRALSAAQLRGLYSGRVRNWKQVGGRDLPVALVSREAGSGTRNAFERYVLRGTEPADTSTDCVHPKFPDEPVLRCERDSTSSLLGAVADISARRDTHLGALGYAELSAATARAAADRNVRLVSLVPDGGGGAVPASAENVQREAYPFAEPEYAYAYGDFSPLASALLDLMGRSSFAHVMDVHGVLSCLPSPGLQAACHDAVAREEQALRARP
jgi:phosphate transport system substrate-binding protein